MSDEVQRMVIKIFRKYSNSLGPDALELVEQILRRENKIDEGDISEAVEYLAREYNKQDDAVMKVSVAVLRRVYDSLNEERTEIEQETIDPESHLYVIDAFEMPRWHWSNERGTFEKSTQPQSFAGSADSRIFAFRDRLDIIRQSVLRNEHFAPSTVPSRDREQLVTLRSTKQLLGRAGERFLLLGMLAYNQQGQLTLEDSDGRVELDFSRMDSPGEGFFTEGSIALTPEMVDKVQEDLDDLQFFFLSDVWLDHPQTLSGLEKMFENCVENDFIPKVIVLCGSFTSQSISHGNQQDVIRYQENFDALADLISRYPQITRQTHFVFIPGPLDVTVNSILPRKPILSSFISRLRAKVPKVHFATNPCRIKFFHQEIVIFRDDLMSRLLRNDVVGVKAGATSEDLKRYANQAHLSPFTLDIQPTLSDFDHAMRLYPTPTVLVLADKYDKYKITYTGCHVFNPGSFVGRSFTWSMYKPAAANSEECVIEFEDEENVPR
ncbi:DNA polymerase alpha/epsilon subunit B-domain-containing protein [Flagelloscypha sp. PMI_526]|nr:DNA polymerase alpha/epsilon subunit B-domain-containing protein [Flagelloscypha sp. PMI_526]